MIALLTVATNQLALTEKSVPAAEMQPLFVRAPMDMPGDHAVQTCISIKNGTAGYRMPAPLSQDNPSFDRLNGQSGLIGNLGKKIKNNIDQHISNIHARGVDPVSGGNAAALLARWSKNNDIGGEALKLFLTALIAMRETMRASRQLSLTLYSNHAALGVKALQLQGDANWKRDLLNAVGQIVSGVMQIGIVTGGYLHNNRAETVSKNNTENAAPAAKKNKAEVEQGTSGTGVAGQSSTMEKTSHLSKPTLSGAVEGEIVLRTNLSKKNQRRAESSESTAAASGAEDAALRNAESKLKDDAMSENTKSQLLQTIAIGARAAGEIATGTFGVASAFYGLEGAYYGADNFRENAEMQKQIFQRDKWSAESDVMFRTMEQVLTSINDMQTRQSESLGKLIGRA